jgi:hypothetical protein
MNPYGQQQPGGATREARPFSCFADAVVAQDIPASLRSPALQAATLASLGPLDPTVRRARERGEKKSRLLISSFLCRPAWRWRTRRAARR